MSKFKLSTLLLCSTMLLSGSALAINDGVGGGRNAAGLDGSPGGRSSDRGPNLPMEVEQAISKYSDYDCDYDNGSHEMETSSEMEPDFGGDSTDLEADLDPGMRQDTGNWERGSNENSVGLAGSVATGAPNYSIDGDRSAPGNTTTRGGLRDRN